jgi:hypothetical protein
MEMPRVRPHQQQDPNLGGGILKRNQSNKGPKHPSAPDLNVGRKQAVPRSNDRLNLKDR